MSMTGPIYIHPVVTGIAASGDAGDESLAVIIAVSALLVFYLGAIELIAWHERIGERYENIKRLARGEKPWTSDLYESPTAIAWFMFKRWLMRKLG